MQTWGEFKARVALLLEGEAERLGLEDSLLVRIKLGVKEIQRHVPELVPLRVKAYGSEDVFRWGEGSTGVFECCQKIDRIVLAKTGTGAYVSDLKLLPIHAHRALTSGQMSGVIYQPSDGHFWVFPGIDHGNELQFLYRKIFVDFADTEVVPYGDLEENYVAEFVRAARERMVNHDLLAEAAAKRAAQQWLLRIKGAMAEMRRTEGVTLGYSSPVGFSETYDGVNDVDHDKTVEFVAVGDFGEFNGNSLEVSNLISWLKPDFFLALGDCNYPNGETLTLETTIRKLYSRYIPNYLFPVWGNHDLMSASDMVYGKPLLDLFGTRISGINGGKLYYHFTRGPVQIFVINSGYSDADPRETDDIFAGGIQGNWLKESLAASTAIWKIVAFHRPAYTSEETYCPGSPLMRWPFKEWGADLVLQAHGHIYERLLVDGLPYLVAGTGGAAIRGIGNFAEGSITRIQEFGALKISATKYNLQVAFYNKDRILRDHFTLNVNKVAEDICGRTPAELLPGAGNTPGTTIVTTDPNTGEVIVTPPLGEDGGIPGVSDPNTEDPVVNDPIDPPGDIEAPYGEGPKLELPIITPEDGSEVPGFPTLVTVDHVVPFVAIYYTLDGSTPTAGSGTLYSGPVSVGSGETIKAIAVKAGRSDSDVAEATYTSSSFITRFEYMGKPGTDKVGRWGNFTPDGTPDLEWQLDISVSTSTEIKEVAIYQTDTEGVWDSGQAWGTAAVVYPNLDTPWPGKEDTDMFTIYALAVFNGATQINSNFGTTVVTLASGNYTLKLYGQHRVNPVGFFRCVVTLGDNSKIKLMDSVA